MKFAQLKHIVAGMIHENISNDTEIDFQAMQLKAKDGVNEQVNMVIHKPERMAVYILQTRKMKGEW